jgi:L-fucose isomerase-like protein
MELRVKTAAFRNAPPDFIEHGCKALKESFPEIPIRFVSDNPDVILFLSGGSEQEAIKSMVSGKYYLLLADFQNNAYAAATEVKAWADSIQLTAQLVSMQEVTKNNLLHSFHRICFAYRSLQGKRAGLIGNVSHWLVASAFPHSLSKERFGININHFLWGKLPDYLSFEPDPEFLEVFKDSGNINLENEARVYSFLQALIKENQLSGFTLECFDMVNDRNVTACLALGLLNSRGIVSGCEGDLVSLTGMMLVQALLGTIPWMANIASINENSVLFAHCTAPLNLLKDFTIPTHFETDKSAAVQGNLNTEEVTVFRLNQHLDKAFISEGKIVSQPRHTFACRTQTEIQLPAGDLEKLRHHPLGNHHLIIPGKHESLLEWACMYKQIEVV